MALPRGSVGKCPSFWPVPEAERTPAQVVAPLSSARPSPSSGPSFGLALPPGFPPAVPSPSSRPPPGTRTFVPTNPSVASQASPMPGPASSPGGAHSASPQGPASRVRAERRRGTIRGGRGPEPWVTSQQRLSRLERQGCSRNSQDTKPLYPRQRCEVRRGEEGTEEQGGGSSTHIPLT